jgi:hypothetical protein
MIAVESEYSTSNLKAPLLGEGGSMSKIGQFNEIEYQFCLKTGKIQYQKLARKD